MAVTNAGQVAAPAPGLGLLTRMRARRIAVLEWAARQNRTAAARAAGVPIRSEEWVLTTAYDLTRSPVVATSAAVWFPDRIGPDRTWWRLAWEEIEAVRWDDRRQVLVFSALRPGGMWRKQLAFASRGAVVDVARERVAATRLGSTTVRLDGQLSAHVTARRKPGSGKLLWNIVLNGQADMTDPAILAKVRTAIAAVQDTAGLPDTEPVIRPGPQRQPIAQ